MSAAHVGLDHVLFFVIALLSPLVDGFWFYPRLVRASAAGVPGARPRFYRDGIATQWVLTVAVLALWVAYGRPWSTLRMVGTTPLRLGIGLVVVAVVAASLWMQRRALLARPERLRLVARQLTAAEALLPHTPEELRRFRFLAITAGICEEVLYRGYVFWYVGTWTNPLAAAVISSVLFGVAHLYLDAQHALRAGIVGLVMVGLVIATGSLWPAMILHAAIDLNSGDLAFRAYEAQRG